MPRLVQIRHPLARPSNQLDRLGRSGVPAFDEVLASHGLRPLATGAIEVLQVNVGTLCNQTCTH